ncbi:hypothetical protein FNV43_RR19694 [Rhamnella rubrinervis]|uniref:DCD domain-containing protein n=1 Tax=Rhamnella rubrinervis TaxID=2594499 RepID=A0A8K0DUJ8_9ROSA|nr:hypothetical protein FNV43_RR19694 [Rhamnella rubrinervis]
MKSKNFQDDEISGLVPEAGAIFMSNCATLEECFERKLFGLPSSYADFVREVKTGMILFLFEYENRKLYGVFEASSDGEMNIVPHAFSSTGKKFPAQVRFKTIWQCHPLNENEFYDFIKENYFTRNKFHFGLSGDQITGLLELFDVRNVEVSEVQDTARTKKRCNKHLSGNEEMEKGRLRSRRKLSHGNSHLVDKQPTSTLCNNIDNYEVLVTPSSMVSRTGCSSLEHEFGMSSFGWGRKPSMSRKEPENLKPSSKNLGDLIPLSLPSSVSYYNEPVMYIEKPENLELPTQDLRANPGEFIPLSFTANKPHMYREEPENLNHPSQDLRTNLGDFIPSSLTANEPSMHNNLKHPSQDLRTNLGDFVSLSFTANKPSLYKQEPKNLKHRSHDLRTNLGDFKRLSLTANEHGLHKQEPENLKHPSQDLRTNIGDFIPLSFTANEPSLYRQESENLKHPSRDLRTNLGDFIPLSFTANEPSLYGEESENLKHPSQDLRTNLGDFIPLSCTANEHSLHKQEPENLKHPSQDLRTNFGDFLPLSFTANEPSLYRQDLENLKHPSQDLRTNIGDFIPLSFTANEPSLYREELENLKHSSQDLRTNLGDFIPLSCTVNEPSLYRREPENLKHSSQDHRTFLRDFIPSSLTANEPSLYGEDPENLKQSSQDLRTNLRGFEPVSFSDTVSDYHGTASGDSVAKERVSVFARLGKVSESDRQDNSVFTRLQRRNYKRKKKITNAKSTVQAKKDNSQGEISVETSSDTLQENDRWKTLIRELVVSTQNHDEYHFKKDKMLKERGLTEERDSADDHWKALMREPVPSVENRECEDNFKKGTKRDPTEESESVGRSKRKPEHRPRRKLIRPSFYKSSEVKDSCSYSSVNEQLPCQESSVGKANNGQCDETGECNRIDGEEDVAPVISPSHCKGDD